MDDAFSLDRTELGAGLSACLSKLVPTPISPRPSVVQFMVPEGWVLEFVVGICLEFDEDIIRGSRKRPRGK